MKLNDNFRLSFQSLRTNKMRTTLTVLGIVVGIFSIIVIMTIITMLQTSIESGISSLSKNTFQIQKDPAMRMGHGPRLHRKDITYDQYQRLAENLKSAKYIGAEQWVFGKVVKFYGKETNPNIQIAGVNLQAIKTNGWDVEEGREFRPSDIQYSANVCLVGPDVAEKLFPNGGALGKTIRVDGYPLTIVGILEKQAQLFGQSRDNYAIIPITTFQGLYGKNDRSINITVMSHSKDDYNELIEAATGYFRTIRKVAPGADNDFDIFSNESMITQVNDITGGVKIGALAVSIIALLAAGVGIMNIMLVSVTERTREIGIRKALGAKKFDILFQFLVEAIALCIFGGLVGIILGVGLGNLAGSLLNATPAIPYDWVAMGLALCIFVGLGFGTYPAYKAANLDPIEALRYE